VSITIGTNLAKYICPLGCVAKRLFQGCDAGREWLSNNMFEYVKELLGEGQHQCILA
jgi:hypothetical protein